MQLTQGITWISAISSTSFLATAAKLPQSDAVSRNRLLSHVLLRVGFMFPSNADRIRKSRPVAHSMNSHAASLFSDRLFITTDHVHRFDRIAPSSPAGGNR